MNKYTIRRIVAVLLLIVVLAAAFLGLKKLVEVQDRFNCQDKVVTVKTGDTLWSIAKTNCIGNIQSAVDHFVSEYGHVIKVGQKIQLNK
jgi:hypothetical protein